MVEPIHHSILAQQVGELSNIRRDPSRLIFGEQLGDGSSPRISKEGHAITLI
jgi:hypothetical protein